MEKLPVLITYKKTVDNGQELRYTLRSLKNIQNWDGRVYIVGDYEKWFKNIHYIPCRKRGFNPFIDAENKWFKACTDTRVPNKFIAMMDDLYITRPAEVKNMHGGELFGSQTNFIRRCKQYTRDYLIEQGIEKPLNYGQHVPMIMEKSKRLEVSKLVRVCKGANILMARSVYGNLYIDPKESIYYADRKTKTAKLRKGTFISTQFYTDELDKLFPEPSKFEEITPLVHMIWLGSRVPLKYRRNISSYERRGYKVRLWTSPLPMMKNRDLFDRAKSYALKADLMRLEILHRYGGLYTDIDSVMVKELATEKPLVLSTSANGFVANETIYATKGHDALKEAIDGIKNHVKQLKECNIWDICGATYLTPIFTKYDHVKLPRTMIGSYGAKLIRHSYDASWARGIKKADKKPLDYWLEQEKV